MTTKATDLLGQRAKIIEAMEDAWLCKCRLAETHTKLAVSGCEKWIAEAVWDAKEEMNDVLIAFGLAGIPVPRELDEP